MMQDREELERVADIKPTRLERRLARHELKTQDAIQASDQAGLGWVGRLLVGLLSALGFAAALIPTLLYFAIVLTPLFLLFTCISHF